MDQRQLVNHCRSGDLDSFEELYRLYRQKALGTAYLIAGRKNLAEDIVQEAFILCYSQIRRLKNPDAFSTWFYRLLVRVAWRMSAKQKSTLSYEDGDAGQGELPPDPSADGGNPDFFDDRILVREAVKKLSPQLKTVVIMYYFNELSIKEIARVLDCFEGTVKSRLHKARKMLEKELKVSFDDGGGPALAERELTANG